MTLSSEAAAEDIWCLILDTVTRKGERSRRIHSADDKSYVRSDLFEWFNQRVVDDQTKAGRKIYVKRKLPHILTPFRAPMASVCDKRRAQVLHQEYFLSQYRYKHIVENVCRWLDEVFLRPRRLPIYTSSRSWRNASGCVHLSSSLFTMSESSWVECCSTRPFGNSMKAS